MGEPALRSKSPFDIVTIYVLIAAGWILFSDMAVTSLISDLSLIGIVSMVKGWLFVAVTAALLFVLIDRKIKSITFAEQELASSQKLLREVIDNAPTLVYIFNRENRLVLCNRAFSALFNRTPQECEGLTRLEMGMSPVSATEHEANDRAVLEGQAASEFEETNIQQDGIHYYVTSKFPLTDSSGSYHAVCGISSDITDRKRADEERERADRLESLGLLAGGIAHDFNNILTAIVGNISLARSHIGTDHRADSRLAACETAISKAAGLSRQLLTFARGGAPVKSAVDAVQLITESVTFNLRGSSVNVRFALSDGLWQLDADADQINQVLGNLVINACQAMPNGGALHVVATNELLGDDNQHDLPAGRYVRIVLTDEGCGIRADILGRIFDPYFTTKPTGTGLGLASVFSIVKRHGGAIDVHSVPGEGAIFTLMLPAADETVGAEKPAGATSSDLSTSVRNSSVLVMDDEDMIRTLVAAMLEQLGYQAVTCADGADAVALYRQTLEQGRPFAAVILDMTIPGGMGGMDAAEQIHRLDPDAVLLVSSGYSVDNMLAGESHPVIAGFLAKPYNLKQLAEALACLK